MTVFSVNIDLDTVTPSFSCLKAGGMSNTDTTTTSGTTEPPGEKRKSEEYGHLMSSPRKRQDSGDRGSGGDGESKMDIQLMPPPPSPSPTLITSASSAATTPSGATTTNAALMAEMVRSPGLPIHSNLTRRTSSGSANGSVAPPSIASGSPRPTGLTPLAGELNLSFQPCSPKSPLLARNAKYVGSPVDLTPKIRPSPLVVGTEDEDSDDVIEIGEVCDYLEPPKTPRNIKSEVHSDLRDAVTDEDVPTVRKLLDQLGNSAASQMNIPEEHGYTLLMDAASASKHSLELTTLLLEKGADVKAKDKEGFTAFHWAISCFDEATCSKILEAGADIDAKAENGDAPLHCASRLGQVKAVKFLLQKGASITIRNAEYLTALDVAGCSDGKVAPKLRALVRKTLFESNNELKTLILWHADCLEHVTRAGHQEGADRITAIMGKLNSQRLFDNHELEKTDDFPRATKEQILRAHTMDYFRSVKELAHEVSAQPKGASVPFTPHVQRNVQNTSKDKIKSAENCDTSFSKGSFNASMRAAGAVCSAIDRVVTGRNRNAFCVVRPPGHHAGRNGLMDGVVSCGFCIFCNVAVGALHCVDKHPHIKKIAIVDFDVHHGNGTEDVLKTVPNCRDRFFFYSIHLFDRVEGYEFYPGTGAGDVVEYNVINSPVAPLWKHLEKEAKYVPAQPAKNDRTVTRSRTGSGPNPKDKDKDSSDEEKVKVSHGSKGPIPAKHPSIFFQDKPKGREEVRQHVQWRLIPALRAFNPDVILISAGFDGARFDLGNGKIDANQVYHNGLDLEASDFAWITDQLQAVANMCCEGRIVSVLEGGYGHYEKAQGELRISRENLASNCAAHVRSLVGQKK